MEHLQLYFEITLYLFQRKNDLNCVLVQKYALFLVHFLKNGGFYFIFSVSLILQLNKKMCQTGQTRRVTADVTLLSSALGSVALKAEYCKFNSFSLRPNVSTNMCIFMCILNVPSVCTPAADSHFGLFSLLYHFVELFHQSSLDHIANLIAYCSKPIIHRQS